MLDLKHANSKYRLCVNIGLEEWGLGLFSLSSSSLGRTGRTVAVPSLLFSFRQLYRETCSHETKEHDHDVL